MIRKFPFACDATKMLLEHSKPQYFGICCYFMCSNIRQDGANVLLVIEHRDKTVQVRPDVLVNCACLHPMLRENLGLASCVIISHLEAGRQGGPESRISSCKMTASALHCRIISPVTADLCRCASNSEASRSARVQSGCIIVSLD